MGREVRLIIYDDGSDPERARMLYKALIERDHIDLIFAPYSSEITEAVAPLAERHGYFMIASGASSDKIWQRDYRYIFGLYSPASRYTQGFLELLVMRGINDLAIVTSEDPFSLEVSEGTRRWAERLGLRIRHLEAFKKGQKDLDYIAEKARASGAKVVILCGHLEESIAMKIALRRIGWAPIYFATVGPATERYRELLGPDSELTFSTSLWEHSVNFKHCKDFHDSFFRTYGIRPTYHAATAYAAGQVIEEAVKRAGTLDRERLRNTMSSMETMTIIGRYKVDRTGLQVRYQNLIIQWQKGRKEVVWPLSLKTAEGIFRWQ